jgi:hypothetical protein
MEQASSPSHDSSLGPRVGFVEWRARNLVRIVDYFPSFYVVGVVSILLGQQKQRLGDAARAKSELEIPANTSAETFLEAVAHPLRELGPVR